MAFEIVEMPSGGIFIKGKLIQKKLTAKSKRLVMLCFPKTIQDVQVLFEHLTSNGEENGLLKGSAAATVVSEDDQREASNKDMEIFGHISLAAISGFPLLVIGTNARTYIHFSQIQGLYDEEDLGQACCFSILTSQSEFRFVSETSTGYQKWVGALSQAFKNMSATAQESYTPQELQNDAGSVISRPTSAMSRDPDDYIEVHRAISANRANSRRSLSQKRQQEYQKENHQLVHGNHNTVSPDYYYPPKKSFWAKMKSVFTGLKKKTNPDYVDGRKKMNHDYANEHSEKQFHATAAPEVNMGMDENAITSQDSPPPIPPKIPRRTKSIAHYLGIEE